MKQIVVDLELLDPNTKPEIIQIGAVCVNTKAHTIVDSFNLICNPEGKLPDAFITTLTGITPAMVAAGTPLKDALTQFWTWLEKCNCGNRLTSWGYGDINLLIEQSRERAVTVPKLKSFDLKMMFELFRAARDSKARGGLKATLETFGLNFIDRQHDALNDAFNTALLLFRAEQMIKLATDLELQFEKPRVRNLDQVSNQFIQEKEKYKSMDDGPSKTDEK